MELYRRDGDTQDCAGHRRWLLTAEFNVGLTLNDDDSEWLGAGKKGQWNPWGGGTISYLW